MLWISLIDTTLLPGPYIHSRQLQLTAVDTAILWDSIRTKISTHTVTLLASAASGSPARLQSTFYVPRHCHKLILQTSLGSVSAALSIWKRRIYLYYNSTIKFINKCTLLISLKIGGDNFNF